MVCFQDATDDTGAFTGFDSKEIGCSYLKGFSKEEILESHLQWVSLISMVIDSASTDVSHISATL